MGVGGSGGWGIPARVVGARGMREHAIGVRWFVENGHRKAIFTIVLSVNRLGFSAESGHNFNFSVASSGLVLDTVICRYRWFGHYHFTLTIILENKHLLTASTDISPTGLFRPLGRLVIRYLENFFRFRLYKIDQAFVFRGFRGTRLGHLTAIGDCHGAFSAFFAHPETALVSVLAPTVLTAIVTMHIDFWFVAAKWSSQSSKNPTTLATIA